MKNFYFFILFSCVLINYTINGQNSYADLQSCTVPQVDYTSSVPMNNQTYWDANFLVVQNPVTTDTANPDVLSIKGNNNANHYITFILPNPISPTAGDTFSLRFYAPNAGSMNTGTGRVIVKFWSSANNTNLRQFVLNKTGGIWETVSGNIDNIQSATLPFDRLSILPHNTSQETGTFDPLYIDDFVISSDQSYEVITLENGNSWIEYPDLSESNYASRVPSEMTLTDNFTNTAQGCPNSGSSLVTKAKRGSGVQSRISYTFNAPIDKANAIFKIRLHPITATALVYGLLRTSTDSGVDQLITSTANYSNGFWHDITFDFSSLVGGLTGPSYNALNIRIDWNSASTKTDNEYLIDAIQGPTSATLSNSDMNKPLNISLQSNPVTNYLNLNLEVDNVKVIDGLGKLILNFENKASIYDVSSLTKGMYFVKVSKAQKSKVFKFIKK